MCSQYFEIYCGSENVNLAKIFCFAQKDNTIVAIHVVHTCTSAKWIMDGMAVQHNMGSWLVYDDLTDVIPD